MNLTSLSEIYNNKASTFTLILDKEEKVGSPWSQMKNAMKTMRLIGSCHQGLMRKKLNSKCLIL